MDLTLYPYGHASEYELYPHMAIILCQMSSNLLFECGQYEQCERPVDDIRFCLQIYY